MAETAQNNDSDTDAASKRQPALPRLIAGWRTFRQLPRTRLGAVIFTALIGIVVAVPSGLLLLSHQGLCFQQGRFLSQEEFIAAAIQRAANSRRFIRVTSVPGAVNFEPMKVIPYSDEIEFRRHNPDCCKIVPHESGPVPTFMERLSGAAAAVVAVTYQVNFLDESGRPQSEVVTSVYVVSNCGRAWDARH
jgi:hypothetical protein